MVIIVKRINIIAISSMLLFFILLLAENCNVDFCTESIAKSGIIDLSYEDINQIYILNGEWGVYDTHTNLTGISGLEQDYYENISKYRKAQEIEDGNKIYRLRVKTNFPTGTLIGFKTITSYECSLYIGNDFIYSSINNDQQPVFYKTQTSEFDIFLVTTGHMISYGHMGFQIYMGTADKILDFNNSLMIKQSILIGALIIIATFFTALSYYVKNGKNTFLFAMICFLIAVVIDVGNNGIFTRQIVLFNPDTKLLIWYIAFCSLMYCIVAFLNELCPSGIADSIKKIVKHIMIIMQIILVFIPVKYYVYLVDFSMIIGFLIYILSALIVAIGIKNKIQDAWSSMISMIILIIVFVHDVILANIIVDPSNRIFVFGTYLILIIQMMIQARRIRLFQEQKSIAELSFLQAQIKPHFLYNVMNTLISISRYDMDKARELMYDFNVYLRNSFDIKTMNQLVQLKYEIELVKAYLDIEKARFEERLTFRFELPDNLEYLVPPLILQPIIENAVNHGILPKPEGGEILIKIDVKNNKLEFMVKDNGVGMAEQQLEEIVGKQKEGSVGLVNIQNRLMILYNRGLDIKSIYGFGTEITWRIPIQQ